MSNEIMMNGNFEIKNTKLRNYTNQIYKQGLSIKKSYARIAVILAKIDTSKCFEMDGFESVHEYAQKVLGIKKSQSYAFLKIGYEYIDSKSLESVLKHEDGNDFSLSQIQAVLPLKSVETAKKLAEHNEINPNMTVKEIKEVVKSYTSNGKSESEESHEISDEMVEVAPIETNRYSVESVLEFVVDENGNTAFMYGDEIINFKQVVELVNEWNDNITYRKN